MFEGGGGGKAHPRGEQLSQMDSKLDLYLAS